MVTAPDLTIQTCCPYRARSGLPSLEHLMYQLVCVLRDDNVDDRNGCPFSFWSNIHPSSPVGLRNVLRSERPHRTVIRMKVSIGK